PREPAPEMEVEARHKPVADQRPHDADRAVADKSKTIAAQDFAEQPAGDRADQQDDDHALIRKMHLRFPPRNLTQYTSVNGALNPGGDSLSRSCGAGDGGLNFAPLGPSQCGFPFRP